MRKGYVWNVRIKGDEAIFEDGPYLAESKGVGEKPERVVKIRVKRKLKSGNPRRNPNARVR